jgi:hypothetical protein
MMAELSDEALCQALRRAKAKYLEASRSPNVALGYLAELDRLVNSIRAVIAKRAADCGEAARE